MDGADGRADRKADGRADGKADARPRRGRVRAMLAALLGLVPACVGPQIEYKTEFEVFVGGENEVCAGDTCGGEGIGQASVEIHEEDGELCYDLELEDIPSPTEAHIHVGGLGENGAAAIDLEYDGDESGGAKCVDDVPQETLRGLIENPRLRYLQVHSERYPDGAARGQFQT